MEQNLPRHTLAVISSRATPASLPDACISSHRTEPKTKLLVQLKDALRARHYSRRTEEVYVQWVKRYCRFHGLRHPAELSEVHINAFLSHLAVEEHVSASTQNQALCALLFLYRHVLSKPIGDLKDVVRARKPLRLPVVMTREEVRSVLAHLDVEKRLKAHNAGRVHSTMNRIPLELLYWEGCLNQQDATRREKYLKTAWGKRYIKTRIKDYLTG